ncbi:MAG: hypothetical protein R2824_24020 [Saprospiraceae bacterium]|nr:hypothetical protein [Lewinella sp.]
MDNNIEQVLQSFLVFFNGTVILTAGFITLLIYLLICTLRKSKVVVLGHLLKSYPVGCAIVVGAKVVLIGLSNNCELSMNENVAFCLGGIAIATFAITSLHIAVKKSDKPIMEPTLAKVNQPGPEDA